MRPRGYVIYDTVRTILRGRRLFVCFRAEKQLGMANKRNGWGVFGKDGARRCRPSGQFGRERKTEEKLMPREGERRGAGRKPGGEEHRHVVGEASKVLRLIAFDRQGVEKDAHSVVSK